MLISDLCLPESAGSMTPSTNLGGSTTSPYIGRGIPQGQFINRGRITSPSSAGQSSRPTTMASGWEQGDDEDYFPAFETPWRQHPVQNDNAFHMRTSQAPWTDGFRGLPGSEYGQAFPGMSEYGRRWPAQAQHQPNSVDLTDQITSHRHDKEMQNPFGSPRQPQQQDFQQHVTQQHVTQQDTPSKPPAKKVLPAKKASRQPSVQKPAPKKKPLKKAPNKKSPPLEELLQKPGTQEISCQESISLEAHLQETCPRGKSSRRQISLPKRLLSEDLSPQELLPEQVSPPKAALQQSSPRVACPRKSCLQPQQSISEEWLPGKPLSQTSSDRYTSLSPAIEKPSLDAVDADSWSGQRHSTRSHIRQDETIEGGCLVIDLTDDSEIFAAPVRTMPRFQTPTARKRPAIDSEDDEESEETTKTPANGGTEYACTFYKRNRPMYFPKRSCRPAGRPSVHRVE